MNNQSFRRNILESKWFYWVVSFFIALTLWVFVTQTQNPIEEKLFDVPISFANLPANMAISEHPDSVKVRVKGLRKDLDDLLVRDISASVDVREANIGQYVGRVSISLPSRVELSSINPLDVIIQVQRVEKVQLPVEVVYESGNSVADGYQALAAIVTPTEVEISGPKDKIEAISKVYVKVKYDNLSKHYEAKLPVYVADETGKSLGAYAQVQPVDVSVLVPVVQDKPSVVLPVKVPIADAPPTGYVITRVVINPQTLEVFGDYNTLKQLDYIYTAPVSVKGKQTDFSTRLDVQMPSGVALPTTTPIDVLIQIEPVVKKIFQDVVVNVENKGDYLYNLGTTHVNVSVSGPQKAVETLNISDINCSIDVADLKSGTSSMPLSVLLPPSLELVYSSPKNVMVTVTKP